jgi:hypothetical protein
VCVAVEPSNGLVTGGGTFRQRPQSPTQCWQRLAGTGPALSPKAQSAAWARCVSVCLSALFVWMTSHPTQLPIQTSSVQSGYLRANGRCDGCDWSVCAAATLLQRC